MAQVKKISVATVYGKISLKEIVEAGPTGIAVMRVAGQAIGTKTGDSNYGPWTALLGRFIAVHPQTGKETEAMQCFLPEVAMIPIQLALANAETRAVDFAIEIVAKESSNTKPGGSPYDYSFNNLAPLAENDPVQKMRALIVTSAAPAIEANPSPPGKQKKK